MKNKKIFKNFISISLSILLGLCFIYPVSAAEPAGETYNEFDMIMQEMNDAKRFRSKGNVNLQKAQESLQELKEHIYKMKEKPIEELRAANYTDSQIKSIQNYDGSDEMTRAASSTITRNKTQFLIKKYNSSTDRTNAKVYITYTMNGVPSPNLRATIAAGLNDGGNWFDSAKGNLVVKYRSYYNGGYHYTEDNLIGRTASNSTGARNFDFELHHNINGYAYYGNTLTLNFEASRQGRIQVVTCVNSFSRITVGPSSAGFSLSVSGLSFSISGGISRQTIDFSAFDSYQSGFPYGS